MDPTHIKGLLWRATRCTVYVNRVEKKQNTLAPGQCYISASNKSECSAAVIRPEDRAGWTLFLESGSVKTRFITRYHYRTRSGVCSGVCPGALLVKFLK
jgi:hypothetical protein